MAMACNKDAKGFPRSLREEGGNCVRAVFCRIRGEEERQQAVSSRPAISAAS